MGEKTKSLETMPRRAPDAALPSRTAAPFISPGGFNLSGILQAVGNMGIQRAARQLNGAPGGTSVSPAVGTPPPDSTQAPQNTGTIQPSPAAPENVSRLAGDKPASDRLPAVNPPRSINRIINFAQQALDLTEFVRSTLFPAYRRAVDALDPIVATELARNVVGSIDLVEKLKSEVITATSDDDYHRFLVSVPGEPDESEAVIAHKFGRLETLKLELLVKVPVFELELAVKIGPQNFRDRPVLDDYALPPISKNLTAYLASEAGAVVELLATVQQIRSVAEPQPGVSSPLTPERKQQIVTLVQPWQSRPVNFAFLVRVLSEEMIWQEVSEEESDETSKTLTETSQEVRAQIQETGAFANVGELNTEKLKDLLFAPAPTEEDPDSDGASGLNDDTAQELFDKLGDAGPEARGPLIRQIDRLGMLDSFCRHLPWRSVKAMQDAILPFDPVAAGLLAQHYEDKSDYKSLSKMEMDQVDEYLSEEHVTYVAGIPVAKGPDKVGAFGWFFLDFLSNAFTFGFHHKYSEALDMRNQGWITNDQFHSTATKALGEAAVVMAASTLTGGLVGEFAQGLAESFEAGESVAEIIGGGAGGVGSGLGGHFAGDVYEQAFEGKEGFDSLGSYVESGAMGGLTGTILAGISVSGGKYLGPGQRPIDQTAARNPGLAKVIEQVRGAGFKSGSTMRAAGIRGATVMRMKVSELLDLAGHRLFGNPRQLAYAGPSLAELSRLPPGTEVTVSIRPSPSFTAPMQMGALRAPGGGMSKPASRGGRGGRAGASAEEPVVDADQPPVRIETVELAGQTPSKQVSTLEEGAGFDPEEVPQEVVDDQAAQERLIKNQQKQVKDAIAKNGKEGKGRIFQRQGAQVEGLARDTLTRIPEVQVFDNVVVGKGVGEQLDHLVMNAANKRAFVESKLTIAEVNQRMINQLNNALRLANPEEPVILHVGRPPTVKEVAALRSKLGPEGAKVQIISDLTELYNTVRAALR
jgi:hypothetical protein